MGAMLDKLNKMSEFTYDNEGVIPEQYRTEEQNQLFNPLHDLTSWVEEWRDDLIKRGQDIANKAGEAYKAGVLPDSIDDMALPQQYVSPAQEKVAIALQDAVDDARYAATKQPISFAGDVAVVVNPWIPLAVQVPIMIKEMQMAQEVENAPEMSDQAKAALLPMLGGTVAASLTHGVGGLLAKTAPKVSKVMTTPFVGSGVAAGAMLAMDENTRKYASEHPQRFAVSTFTTDAALGVKKLSKVDWSIKTNPTTNTEAIAEKTNPTTSTVVENKSAELANKAIGEPTTTKVSEIKPIITKESKSVTPKEEAFPERQPNIVKSQEMLADQIADEIKEARRLPEVQQGAYGDKLTYSKDNLYPRNVSVNEIWQTFKLLVPIRPNGMGNRPDSTLGFFNTVGKGIRVRGFKSWSVMCHELGHAASDKFGFAKGADVEMELAKGAHSIWSHGEYGNFNSPEGFSAYIEEGRAAFMNEYMVNPKLAKKHFPLTYDAFEQALATDMIWQTHMNTIGQQVRRWGNMNVMQKAAGTTQWGDTTNTGIAQKISAMKDGLEAGYADEFAPLRNVKNTWEKVYGIKTAIEDDPAILAQRAKESINASELTLFNGNGFSTDVAVQQLANKFRTPLNNIVFSDIFLPFTVGGERGVVLKQWLEKAGIKDYYEAFSKYQGAKHELEVINIKNAERIKKYEETIKALDVKNPLYLKQKQKLIKKIKDIKDGVDDYVTSMTRQENEAILTMCKDIPEFEEASQLWKAWNDNILRIAVAGDILKKSTKDYFQQTYPEYIPMKRDFTIEGDLSAHGDIRHILTEEGSSRVVKDPMMQAVLDMKTVVSKVERNYVGQALAKMANGEYGHYLMMKVPDGKEAKAHQIITVWEKGRPTYYQCTADGLYDAFTSTNKAFVQMNLDVISATMETLATTLRVGATSTPAFAAWNLERDLLDATILNADGRGKRTSIAAPLELLWDGMTVALSDTKRFGIGKAMAHLDKNNAANKNIKAEYMTQGVQYTTMLHTPKDITKHLRKIATPKSDLDKVKDIALEPLRTLIAFNETCEQLARMGLYKRVKQRGGSAIEAATVASDSTVNFMRSGTVTKKYNRVIPFFNATIQGGLKFIKEWKKDPVGVMLASFKYITLPTLMMYYLNKDEDWYKDMPLDQKNKAWYIKINGTIYSFAKPPVLGQLFGSLPERLLDVALEDDTSDAPKDCLVQAAKGFFPTYTSPAIEKLYEWKANYNFYKGRPIVDQRLGKLSDENQYTPYTSESAKWAGRTFGVSPMKVDNTFYGLTGSLGYAFNALVDWGLKENETADKKWTEYTRFNYTKGGRQTRSQDVFFKAIDKLEKQSNDAKRLGKPLKDTKAFEGMKEAREMAKLVTNGITKNTKASRKLGKWASDPDVRRGLKNIEADPKLSGAEKRAKIDKLVRIRNDIYRTANKKYLNYKYIQSPE
ncbi:LPD38 domain-containing protein [Phascolarctobacterium succinatutens]|uniref:LPD38 domain-containing protein n=1 Tax=Phascolarctobacterium succinatutens TaxID=626940 RepID=UPI00307FA081